MFLAQAHNQTFPLTSNHLKQIVDTENTTGAMNNERTIIGTITIRCVCSRRLFDCVVSCDLDAW